MHKSCSLLTKSVGRFQNGEHYLILQCYKRACTLNEFHSCSETGLVKI